MDTSSRTAMLTLLFTFALAGTTSAQSLRPRMVVLTGVSTWGIDDSESLVRLMVHAGLLEIEGLVFTTGWSLEKTRDDFMGLGVGSAERSTTILPLVPCSLTQLISFYRCDNA